MRYIFILFGFVLSTLSADDGINKKTKYLLADKLVFEEKFETDISKQEHWFLRKSQWLPENGVLKGVSLPEGNGAFLRLKGKSAGGLLPEEYVMSFKFKAGDKDDGTSSPGNRVSLGHSKFRVLWRGESGIMLDLVHGRALEDTSFKIMKGKWYDVIIECSKDEAVFSIKNGPTYYAQHEVLKDKSAGWEYFLKKGEVGYLDDLRVWTLASGSKEGWSGFKMELKKSGKAFVQSENPGFKTEKVKAKKKKK